MINVLQWTQIICNDRDILNNFWNVKKYEMVIFCGWRFKDDSLMLKSSTNFYAIMSVLFNFTQVGKY